VGTADGGTSAKATEGRGESERSRKPVVSPRPALLLEASTHLTLIPTKSFTPLLGGFQSISQDTPPSPLNTNDKQHAYPTHQRPYLSTTSAIALRRPHWAGQDTGQGSPSCTSSTHSGCLGEAVPESPCMHKAVGELPFVEYGAELNACLIATSG